MGMAKETDIEHIDLNNLELQNALQIIQYTHRSLFLTGKAGTGKSTFLRYISQTTKKKHVILPEGPRIRKQKEEKGIQKELAVKFTVGDSVLVLPDKKTGIVCRTVNEKGVLQVQLQDRKIWINHKRIKLLVAAEELYPEDYDFSIIFDTVENRKNRHQMERKHQEGVEIRMEDE